MGLKLRPVGGVEAINAHPGMAVLEEAGVCHEGVLDPDVAPAWARRHGIEGDLAALARDEAVIAAVQEGVDVANKTLSSPETIKRFTLLGGDWLPGGDELTPTMKLKRRPVEAKYADAIAAMY